MAYREEIVGSLRRLVYLCHRIYLRDPNLEQVSSRQQVMSLAGDVFGGRNRMLNKDRQERRRLKR